MAVVTESERQNIQWARRHPTETETECEWAVFDDGGRRYLQIQSVGSRERQTGGVSQTYQFTAESARELLDVLRKAFPGLG